MLAGAPQILAHGHEPDLTAPHRDGIVLLAFREGTAPALQEKILASVGAYEIKRIGVGVHVVAVKPGELAAAIQSLQAREEVRYAEPDYLQTVSAASLPNDTFVGLQWAVQNTGQAANGSSGTPGADERSLAAWGITTGTNSVVIAETDTGIQYSHPDLITNMWNNPGGIGGCAAGTHGYNVLSSSCDPMDDDNDYGGHGTHVAGIMGAVGNDAAGTAGVNWTTSIMAIKWVDSSGNGATSDLITGLDWVVSAKQSGINIRIVNDSQTWAGTAFSQALSDEIDTLGSNDILFVTASGNTAQNNDTTPRYPCSYERPTEICVAASDQNDNLWSSANWGPKSDQLAAPGVNIYSTLRVSNYGYISGGSMASPQVAGTAALILSLGYQSVANLRSMILNNVDVLSSLSGLVGTSGRLDVCKALPGCSTAVAATPANTIAPVVTSLPQQGGLVGASTGAWSGIPSTYTYQWSRCNSSGSSCAAIPGATGQTYAMLAPQDAGDTLMVTVTGSNSFGSTAAQSPVSGVVASETSASAIGSTIVSGTTINGSVNWTLTPARSEQFVQFFIDGVLTQTDSSSPYTFSSGSGTLDTTTLTNGAHILGARALFTDNRTYDFYGETVTVSNPPKNTALPVLSGTVQPGQTLSTTNGAWNPNAPPASFTYQWEHCDSNGLNCNSISGANSSTYALSGADSNFTIRAAVTAINAAGSVVAVSNQTIVVPAPAGLSITTASLSNGEQNVSYSATLAASGGTAPYTWSISSGSLPAVLGLASNTGVISGTPSGTGMTSFTVKVTDSNSLSATKTLSITVVGPPSITTTSLPGGTQNAAYSTALAVSGGVAPYTWSISSGSLPPVLSIAPSTGVISGTPSGPGTTSFTVQVSDANAQKATMPLSITVSASSGGSIGLVQENAAQGSGVSSLSATFPSTNTASNLILVFVRMSSSNQSMTLADTAGNSYAQAVGQVQTADGSQAYLYYAKNITGASGNKVTATFSGSNNHPFIAIFEYKGLSTTGPIDQTAHAMGNSTAPNSGLTATTASANELIFAAMGLPASYSGTQTVGSGYTFLEQDTSSSPAATAAQLSTATGTFAASFTLSANANWSALVATFTAGGPSSPSVTTASLPNGEQNVSYTAALAESGGTQPFTWAISSGSLPAGLTLNSSTGVIAGTPTATGTTNFTVEVTDFNSLTATKPLSIAVVGPPSITTTSLPGGTQNAAYNTTLAVSGGVAPYTWSISSGSLPPVLSIAPSTGVISGTPNGPGTASFTVQVSDANSQKATMPLSITVSASSGGGIGLVQENAAQGSGVSSLSATFPSTNTAGNLILVFVRMSSSNQSMTLADTAGNSYAQAVGQVQTADGSQAYLYYAKNITGASGNKVTATFSGSNNHPFIAIFEYKGLSTTGPLDQTAHTMGNSTAPNSGLTATTASANELIFAAMGLPASYSGTQTVGSGYTFLEQDTSSSPAATAAQLSTATGTFAASFTLSHNANWSALIATFKP